MQQNIYLQGATACPCFLNLLFRKVIEFSFSTNYLSPQKIMDCADFTGYDGESQAIDVPMQGKVSSQCSFLVIAFQAKFSVFFMTGFPDTGKGLVNCYILVARILYKLLFTKCLYLPNVTEIGLLFV